MNSRRLMCAPEAKITPYHAVAAVLANLSADWPFRVKSSKAHNEQIFSGPPPKSGHARHGQVVGRDRTGGVRPAVVEPPTISKRCDRPPASLIRGSRRRHPVRSIAP